MDLNKKKEEKEMKVTPGKKSFQKRLGDMNGVYARSRMRV